MLQIHRTFLSVRIYVYEYMASGIEKPALQGVVLYDYDDSRSWIAVQPCDDKV